MEGPPGGITRGWRGRDRALGARTGRRGYDLEAHAPEIDPRCRVWRRPLHARDPRAARGPTRWAAAAGLARSRGRGSGKVRPARSVFALTAWMGSTEKERRGSGHAWNENIPAKIHRSLPRAR